MGWFGGRKRVVVAAPKPPKRKRATKAEVAERLRAQLAAEKARLELDRQREEREFLAWLKENDPQRYRAMIEKRMGLGEGDKGEAGPSNIWSALAEGAKNMPQLAQALKGGSQFPPDAVHLTRQDYEELTRRAGLSPTTEQPQPDAAPVAPVPASSPALAAPTAPTAPPDPVVDEPRDGETAGQFIVRHIESGDPATAARWLWALGKRHPEIGEQLDRLRKAPTWSLPRIAFPQIEGTPGLEALGRWCQEHRDRVIDIIAALQAVASAA